MHFRKKKGKSYKIVDICALGFKGKDFKILEISQNSTWTPWEAL